MVHLPPFLRGCTYFLILSVLFVSSPIEHVFAGTLSTVSDTLSSTAAKHASTTHTLGFTTATSDNIKEIDIQFATTNGGNTKPAYLNVAGTTLGTLSNIGVGWSLSTISAASGKLILNRSTADPIAGSVTASIELLGITNSAIDDCEASNVDLSDTCYVKISTFSDDGTTLVDSGTTTYTVYEDATLSFEVFGESSGQTHNGITTSLASTSSGIPFGTLRSGHVKYIAQKLHISTNAPHGYTVNAYLAQNITGTYAGAQISPFGATNATWSTPQNWSTPTGTTANTNSGWFGANTTDWRVSGWASTSAKFGPISGSAHAVAYSSDSDRGGTDVFVTYAIEVNSVQPADYYSGKIVYDVQASY